MKMTSDISLKGIDLRPAVHQDAAYTTELQLYPHFLHIIVVADNNEKPFFNVGQHC